MIYNRPRPKSSDKLPDGYIQLEYIESTGTQYIDTGVKPKSTTKVVMDFQVTAQPTDHKIIFGCRTSYSSADQFVLGFAGHKSPAVWRSDFGSSQENFPSTVLWSSRFMAVRDGPSCALNTDSVTNSDSAFTTTHNLFLLGDNDNETANGFISAKLYSCQIYDNGRAVRKFIPCLSPSMVVGLYDTVTKTFFANAGTGTFSFEPPEGFTVGMLPVGSVVKIPVNSKDTEFIVIQQGNPDSSKYVSAGGTWLTTKDAGYAYVWDGDRHNQYETSDVRSFLENTWIYRLPSTIQSAIKQCRIPYCAGMASSAVGSGNNGLLSKVFILSGTEMGFSDNTMAVEGANLAYFSNTNSRKSSYINWLRSPMTSNSNRVYNVTADGLLDYEYCDTDRQLRPTLILPTETIIDGTNIKLG